MLFRSICCFSDSMRNLTYSLFRGALKEENANWISTYQKNSKSLEKLFAKVIEALTAEE